MRTALLISAATFCLPVCLPFVAVAQGVPVQDNSGLGQLVAMLGQLGEDATTQREVLSTEEQLAEIQAEQLRVLEEITDAITGQGFNIQSLEAMPVFRPRRSTDLPQTTRWTAASSAKAVKPSR